jgi:glycosyltransferase involved in cell wall biosynthesis
MRILHIVNWYPNAINPHEAPFIQRHVEAMRGRDHCTVWHVETRLHDRWGWITGGGPADRTLILLCPLRRWMVIELLTALLVLWAWITRPRAHRFDVVNFYIAYPLCTHLRLLRAVIRRPFMMMEQWSAYHFNFSSSSRGLDRIRRIFRHRIPVICVSTSLAADIRRFSGVTHLACPVVPNVVLVEHFSTGGRSDRQVQGDLFAISGWKRPKRPEVLVEALAILRDRGRIHRLRIAGDGPELPKTRERVLQLGLASQVEFVGRLDAPAAAREMRAAFALLHCSDYETFSVVCAEALCCGTPVIASNVGGIPSFVNGSNGVLVASTDPETWAKAIEGNWQRLADMDRRSLSATNHAKFSPEAVGDRLHDLFQRRAAGEALSDI